MRDVTEYDGIKYSLQPHGLKSKLIMGFVFFVVAFGGALALASPAQAVDPTPTPGQVDCSVWVTQSPQPTSSPTPPAVVATPTTCPTVTQTVTQNVNVPGPTVTVVKTVYMPGGTETVVVTQSAAAPSETPVPSTTPRPSRTPDPLPVAHSEDDGGLGLVGWGLGVAAVGGVALTAIGIAGIRHRRRYVGAHQAGENEHDVSDYDPDEYDEELGGRPGDTYPRGGLNETMEFPAVDDDATKPIPRVE